MANEECLTKKKSNENRNLIKTILRRNICWISMSSISHHCCKTLLLVTHHCCLSHITVTHHYCLSHITVTHHCHYTSLMPRNVSHFLFPNLKCQICLLLITLLLYTNMSLLYINTDLLCKTFWEDISHPPVVKDMEVFMEVETVFRHVILTENLDLLT